MPAFPGRTWEMRRIFRHLLGRRCGIDPSWRMAEVRHRDWSEDHLARVWVRHADLEGEGWWVVFSAYLPSAADEAAICLTDNIRPRSDFTEFRFLSTAEILRDVCENALR